jgi:hypothetical protein
LSDEGENIVQNDWSGAKAVTELLSNSTPLFDNVVKDIIAQVTSILSDYVLVFLAEVFDHLAAAFSNLAAT